ncbi:hypothetical protein ACSV4D_10155 [Flavobacterium sp. ARAG 55.4]|uniref:hypothetical protein n=1 Tax=Flavobacterium sp. ARAG 55.4 TaxID=3451357 RepID=UPI003F46137B
MKKILLFTFFTISIYASEIKGFEKQKLEKNDVEIISNTDKIKTLNEKIDELNKDYEKQEKINEKTLDSISNQISAASLNLTIFGILFSVAAIGLGLYVTHIERKIVLIREENKSLLSETKIVKDDVVKINTQIQKDIYGLFLKIKREETLHILERLSKIPEDISNLSQQLLSRELEKNDFIILKEAYLKLKEKISLNIEDENEDENNLFDFNQETEYLNSYKLLFFQHFLDLAIKDSIINEDLIDYYDNSVNCAFENDIIKSTTDFTEVLMETGLQTKTKEINAFIKALSLSKFKTFDDVYQIIFKNLQTRDNHFNLFNLLNDDKEIRIGKLKIGQIITEKYSNSPLSEKEQNIINKTVALSLELETETNEKNIEIEKQKKQKAERLKKQEEAKAERLRKQEELNKQKK